MSATRLSFSYPLHLKEALKELAGNEARSLSSYIQLVLIEHLKSKGALKSLKKRKMPGGKKSLKKRKVGLKEHGEQNNA